MESINHFQCLFKLKNGNKRVGVAFIEGKGTLSKGKKGII